MLLHRVLDRPPSAVLTCRQLLRRSRQSIRTALHSPSPDRRAIAERLAENERYYADWWTRHWRLMESAAEATTPSRQIAFLRASVLSLAHVGSIGGLMRNRRLRGPERTILLATLHRNRDEISALLSEHRNFIRAEASSICARDILESLGDLEFQALYSNYQQLLEQHLSLLAGAALADANGEPFPLRSYLSETKRILSARRAAILGAPVRSWPTYAGAAYRIDALYA